MKILGKCFGVKIRKNQKYEFNDKKYTHHLVDLLVEDDGNWFKKTTFDAYWLDDIIEVLTKSRDALKK